MAKLYSTNVGDKDIADHGLKHIPFWTRHFAPRMPRLVRLPHRLYCTRVFLLTVLSRAEEGTPCHQPSHPATPITSIHRTPRDPRGVPALAALRALGP
jgi:hypothetical protein